MVVSKSPDIPAENSTAPSDTLLLSAIIDSSDDAIVSKTLEGIVTSWNKSAERIFGYRAEEIIGQPLTILFPPDRMDEEPAILDRLKRGERVDHFETVRVRKNGELVDVSVTISPIRTADGRIIGASKIARDVTEQKRAALALAQAHEELRRADRMKGEFLSTLSHELRTPLNAIVGWVQILKDGPLGPEELAEGLTVIERNTRAQTQMIEDLLDMSRIEAGKVSLDIQSLDLATVVNSALESIRPTAEAKQVKVRSAFSTVDGFVMGDRNRLQQVVWNLLTNAIKFTPKGGRVHVIIERANSHVEIAVSDNGQGIAPEFLDRVFERFGQADATTTRRHGGLGLGLSIVKQLVELHGGETRVKSEGLGKGATFIVSLPLIAAHPHPARAAAGDKDSALNETAAINVDLSGINILVVDDELDSLMVIRRILEARHAQVQVADSMEEALKLFAAVQPDVVLSDIGMPEHDGYELITRLRKLPGGRSVPAVALTALARSEDRTQALHAGFQMHVAKPVDANELVAVVMNLATLRTKET